MTRDQRRKRREQGEVIPCVEVRRVIRFSCPHCNKALKADASKIGRLTRCPKCKSPIEVPRSQGESILAEEQFSIIEEPPARMPVPQEPAAQVPAEATYPSPAAWEPEPQKHRTGMLVACLCLTMVLFAAIMLAVAIHLHNKQQAMVTVKTEPQALAYGQPVKKQDSVAD